MLPPMAKGWYGTSVGGLVCATLAFSCGRTASDGRASDTAQGATGVTLGGASEGGAQGANPVEGGRAATASGGDGVASLPQPGSLFEDDVTEVQVVSDREGNAMVEGIGSETHFAHWHEAEQEWSRPGSLSSGHLVETNGSDRFLLTAVAANVLDGPAEPATSRFDLKRDEWGPARAVAIYPFDLPFVIAADGAGNAFAYGYDRNLDAVTATWWAVDQSAWALPAIPPGQPDSASEVHLVGAGVEGAWYWEGSPDFIVRYFDTRLGSWSARQALQLPGASDDRRLVVGRSGEALAVTVNLRASEVVVEAQRYDPVRAAWQPKETAFQAPSAGAISAQLFQAFTDSAQHDIVVVGLRTPDAFELRIIRREPTTGVWTTVHTVAAAAAPDQVLLAGDLAGNVYGCISHLNSSAPPSPSSLLAYDAATQVWKESQVDGYGVKLAASGRGAFVVVSSSTGDVPYRQSGTGTEWRRARGMPEGELWPDSMDLAAIGDERALFVWVPHDMSGSGQGAASAAFIE